MIRRIIITIETDAAAGGKEVIAEFDGAAVEPCGPAPGVAAAPSSCPGRTPPAAANSPRQVIPQRRSDRPGQHDGEDLAGGGASMSGCPGQPDTTANEDLTVRARLELQELDVHEPERFLRHYRPERILEVCAAARRKENLVKSPGGWTAEALPKCWKV